MYHRRRLEAEEKARQIECANRERLYRAATTGAVMDVKVSSNSSSSSSSNHIIIVVVVVVVVVKFLLPRLPFSNAFPEPLCPNSHFGKSPGAGA